MGSQNGLFHGFFSWDRLKLLQGREPEMKQGEHEGARREQERAGGSNGGEVPIWM